MEESEFNLEAHTSKQKLEVQVTHTSELSRASPSEAFCEIFIITESQRTRIGAETKAMFHDHL